MKTNPEYRAEARLMLGGNIFSQNWLMALVAFLIISAISGALAATGVGSVLTLIITGPLSVGFAAFMFNIRRENKAELGKLFEPFSTDFVGSMLLGIMYSLFITLWTLLFIVPGIVKSYAYSMCFYIKKDNPEMDWNACLKESMRMTDGHKAQLFLLDLSFIGWILLSMLTCGIGLFWVTPYASASRVAFYEDLKAQTAPKVTVE